MKDQMTLFELEPIEPTFTASQKRKWTQKYSEYCYKVYTEEGDFTGAYCCGYHWCCDECSMRLCNGCADCVHTIKLLAKKFGIEIDYSNYDFKQFETKVKERYKDYEQTNFARIRIT